MVANRGKGPVRPCWRSIAEDSGNERKTNQSYKLLPYGMDGGTIIIIIRIY